MAYEMSIEVLDGEFPAHLWVEAHGDSLVESALQCGVIEWRWQHFDWGVVLEIDFSEESGWERFRASTAVQAALDAVPDRFSGLLIYRGKGGSSAPRMPRRPRPRSGAGAVALEFPDEWVFERVEPPPVMAAAVRAVDAVAREAVTWHCMTPAVASADGGRAPSYRRTACARRRHHEPPHRVCRLPGRP